MHSKTAPATFLATNLGLTRRDTLKLTIWPSPQAILLMLAIRLLTSERKRK
jgi:hypothetical protein